MTPLSPLKFERLRAGLSQVRLYERSGVPQHRISLLERGLPAKAGEIERLAKALRVAPEELLPRDGG